MRTDVLVLGFAAAVLFFVVVRNKANWIFLGILVTIIIAPITILSWGYAPNHVGITAGTVTASTVTGAVVVYVLLERRSIPWRVMIPILPFLTYLVLGSLLLWESSPAVWSGTLHYAIVSLSFAVGCSAAIRVNTADLKIRRFLVGSLFVIAALELVICIAQSAGLDSVFQPLYFAQVNDATLMSTEGRVYGTTDHPGTLGKMLFAVLLCALPLTVDRDRWTRNAATFAVGIALLPIAMTEGRANFIATVILLGGWLVFGPLRGSVGRRLTLLTVGGLVVAVSYAAYQTRFAQDPAGGPRERLLRTAWEQINMRPFVGTGPNNWVAVVGKYDNLTSEGWPVHNIFILLIGETGYLGLLLAIGGVSFGIYRAVRNTSQPMRRPGASAVLLALPGIAVIGWTGWGLAAGGSAVILALALGFCSTYSLRSEPEVEVQASLAAKKSPGVPIRGGQK